MMAQKKSNTNQAKYSVMLITITLALVGCDNGASVSDPTYATIFGSGVAGDYAFRPSPPFTMSMQPGAVIDAIYTTGGRSFNIVCKKEESIGNTTVSMDAYNASGSLDSNIQTAKDDLAKLGQEKIASIMKKSDYSSIESITIDYSATSILSVSDTTVKIAVKNGMQIGECTDSINSLYRTRTEVAMIKGVLVGDVKYNVNWHTTQTISDAEKEIILGNLSNEIGSTSSGTEKVIGKNVYWPFVAIPAYMFLPAQ